ncbi:YheC/YheD family protein [Paenibacillus glycanilyticus]|uniref:YheC/YheD family endospore coat-associated protein n=1 Tax=Paenibacillus glycanilyticus TaxID=126569 RepID=UPI00203B3078|nr:YheC/YheD family protein [Paenibacillus glycanilyticus]MCM3630019.1 YheC/YheD family protein [Paenibacillus glycanilyticus]
MKKAMLVRVGMFVAAIESGAEAEDHGGIKLPEPALARLLSDAAGPLGIDLFVFSPAGYEERTGRLTGFRLRNGRWLEEPCPVPDIIYDRCFYRNAEERTSCRSALAAMRERHPSPIPTLNGGLPGKWEVYHTLRQDPSLARLLPETSSLERPETLPQLLRNHNKDLFLKPSAGMQGRGAIRLSCSPLTGQWTVAGRTRKNLSFSRRFNDYPAMAQWIGRFMNHASYIAQPYLQLLDPDGNPFDLRVLVQKTGKGRWGITGSAIRTGSSGSVTSNLHGGGTAKHASEYLIGIYGAAKAERMMNTIQQACLKAAERLENNYGRLAELGIDFGIEPDGQIWLLEVNAKPGRSSFRQFGDRRTEQLSAELPLSYARLLTQRHQKPLITNDSATGRFQSCRTDRGIRPDNVQEVHP